MDIVKLNNATLEAIYWWNRDEFFYHNYFSKLDFIYKDKEKLDFFQQKIFEVFLRGYSVRINISSGQENVRLFIDELIENNFVENVRKGRSEVIDNLCEELKKNQKSTKRNTKSLLSKIAFLINPQKFSLYDSLAKETIWDLQKNNLIKSRLCDYTFFLTKLKFLKKILINKVYLMI